MIPHSEKETKNSDLTLSFRPPSRNLENTKTKRIMFGLFLRSGFRVTARNDKEGVRDDKRITAKRCVPKETRLFQSVRTQRFVDRSDDEATTVPRSHVVENQNAVLYMA